MDVFQALRRRSAGILWAALLLALAAVHVSIATGVISRWHFYNADALYIPLLYRDLFSPYSLLGWSLQPAPSFFPDMLIYFTLHLLTNNLHLAIMLYGVVQSLACVGGLVSLARLVFGRSPVIRQLILLAGIALFCLVATGGGEAFLSLLQMGHHGGVTLLLIVSLVLAARILQAGADNKPVSRAAVLLFGCASAALLSDALYLVQCVFPVLVSVLGLHFVGIRLRPKTGLAVGIPFAGAIVVMYLGNRFVLRAWKPPIPFLENDLDQLFQQVLTLPHDSLLWSQTNWGASTFIPVIQIIWFAFIAVSLAFLAFAFKTARRPGRPAVVQPLVVFVISVFVCSSLGTVLVGWLTRNTHPRYALPALLFPVFFGWPFLVGGCRRVRRWFETPAVRAATAGGVLLLAGVSGSLGNLGKLSALGALSTYYPELVQCVDARARERNLRYGLAQYWHAKPLKALSQAGLHVVQVQQSGDDLFMDHWINNANWYNHDFEFVLTDNMADSVRKISAVGVINRFGQPAEVFVCQRRKILIYSDREFQQQFKQQGFSITLPAAQLPSDTGELAGASRIAEEGRNAKGFVTYGPYLQLFLGDYSFEIQYQARSTDGAAVGTWDIVNHTSGKATNHSLERGALESGGAHIVSGVFKIRRIGITEIRTHYDGHGTLRVDKILIRKIK